MAALWLLLGLLIGGVAVALLARPRLTAAARDRERLASEAGDAEAGRQAQLERAHELERELVVVRGELQAEVVQLQADLEHEQALAEEKLRAVQQANEQLAQSFKALCADALNANNTQFLELAKATFGEFQTQTKGDLDARQQAFAQMVDKVGQSLTQVDGKLDRLDRDRREQQGALQQHLRSVVETQDKLRVETGALVAALRQPHTRGRWGEMQLKRVIEMAGMLPHCDFDEQSTVQGEDGRLRPDVVVNLPGGKKIVVDAKAPLQSFLDAYQATDDAERVAHMRSHARQLRDHIRKLSARSYWSQFEDAPDFVFLFLPGEHFYNAALEADPALLEESVNQCVLIATPTTLIALLRAVAYGWQQEKVAEGAREISELGRELHSRLAVVADHLQSLGRRLNSTVEAFNGTVGSMEGRVLVAARKFADHGAVSAGKELKSLEPIDVTARKLQAPELGADDQRALMPADRPAA
jgi:DNA recombination protein RmuC